MWTFHSKIYRGRDTVILVRLRDEFVPQNPNAATRTTSLSGNLHTTNSHKEFYKNKATRAYNFKSHFTVTVDLV